MLQFLVLKLTKKSAIIHCFYNIQSAIAEAIHSIKLSLVTIAKPMTKTA